MCCLAVGCGQGDRGGVSLQVNARNSSSPLVLFSSSAHSSSAASHASSSLPNGASIEDKPMHLVAQVGKCLQILLDDYLNATEKGSLQSWDCYAKSSHQQWIWKETGELVSLNQQCLTVGEQNKSGGVNIYMSTCKNTVAQKWYFDELTAAITNDLYPDLCVDIWNSESETNGKLIQLYKCLKGHNQRWAAQEIESVFIRNWSNNGLYLNINPSSGLLEAMPVSEGWVSATWQVEPLGDAVRLRNSWDLAKFINYDNSLVATDVLWGWHSARWYLVPREDLGKNKFLIRNYWKPDLYVGLGENNTLVIDGLDNLVDGTELWVIDKEFLAK